MATLYLLHGFVGSGKTTFAKRWAQEKGYVRFTPDEWTVHFYGVNPPAEQFEDCIARVKSKIWEMSEAFLTRGHDVLLDYGFWRRADRDIYRQRAKDMGVECVIIDISTDFELCKKRVLARTEAMPEGALVIDENAINLFWQSFEPLQDDEAFVSAESL